jgi:Predicted molecular chaperone distantly related to HSP70-fold metalloproteases
MRIIGLMSGTSLDGVDAALVAFDGNGQPTLQGFHSLPYPPDLRRALAAIDAGTPLGEALAMDAQLSAIYAQAVATLCAQTQTTAATIDAIGVHGQTVIHAPRATPPVTCQLGDPSRLAEQTGIAVVADFRQRDLAVGGEGAPLAPLFHAALFGADHPRGVVNLGGIANLSVLGAGGRIVSGFDCGPANTLLDGWIQRHHNQPFDHEGAWAASGRVDHALLARLQSDAFLPAQPPKARARIISIARGSRRIYAAMKRPWMCKQHSLNSPPGPSRARSRRPTPKCSISLLPVVAPITAT